MSSSTQQLEVFADRLASRMKRSRWPKHRRLTVQVGVEFMRAAVDGREPARWAQAALQPRSTRRKA